MIDLFSNSEYIPVEITFLANMVCKWSHAGTTLTLVEINWYRSIRSTFHLLVEEGGGSKSTPVSLGINRGWDEIHDAVKAQVPPPDLLENILRRNPDLENLVLDHSPNSQLLTLKNLGTSAQPLASQNRVPAKLLPKASDKPRPFWHWLKLPKWVKREKNL